MTFGSRCLLKRWCPDIRSNMNARNTPTLKEYRLEDSIDSMYLQLGQGVVEIRPCGLRT